MKTTAGPVCWDGGWGRSAERAWNGFELLAGEQLAANAALVEPLEDLER